MLQGGRNDPPVGDMVSMNILVSEQCGYVLNWIQHLTSHTQL